MEHEVCAYCGEQITGVPFQFESKYYCDETCADKAQETGEDADYE